MEAMKLINTYMRLKGVSQAELARWIGATPADISQVLNGKKGCTPQMLDRILGGLGFPNQGVYPSIIAEVGAGLFRGINKHISASKLSELSGVPVVTIRKIRATKDLDRLRTNLEDLLKLAEVLDVEYSWNGLKEEIEKKDWFE